jgi:hypothetical protein
MLPKRHETVPVSLDRQPGGQGGRRDDGAQAPSTPASKAGHVSPDARGGPAGKGPIPAAAQAAPSERRSQPQSGNAQPQKGFDASELVEDFEDPICQFCLGVGHVRDENGIHMVTCDHCEGKGRAPARE